MMALMNKKLTPGHVTAIYRNESNTKTAYVHYADYRGKLFTHILFFFKSAVIN